MKNWFGLVPAFIFFAFSCNAIASPAGQATRTKHQASPERIRADIARLVAFGTRHTLSDTESETRGIGAARRWLAAELEEISRSQHSGRMQVELVAHTIEPGRRIPDGARVVNVVATLPGSDSDRLVVVSGHYDSINSDGRDAEGDAPGANDDASGTAVVLECARLLAGVQPRATVVFLAVAGEEQGLLGSRAQALAWQAEGKTVEAFLTNDIVGGARGSNGRLEPDRVRLFSEGVPTRGRVSGSDNDAPSRQLARYLKQRGEAALEGFEIELIFRQDRFGRGGDHKPFNEIGVAGVRFTEPNENYDWQHQDVREEDGVRYGDRLENVDFEFVARVATVNAAGLRELALAPRPPEGVAMSTRGMTPHTRLSWKESPGASGYRVRLRRTAEPVWTHSIDAGKTAEILLEGYSKDDWLFAVEAYDANGHASLPVYPLSGRR